MSKKEVPETVVQVGKQIRDNQENYATRIIICTSFEKSVREEKHLLYHKYGIGNSQTFLIENLTEKKCGKFRHRRKKKISGHRK